MSRKANRWGVPALVSGNRGRNTEPIIALGGEIRASGLGSFWPTIILPHDNVGMTKELPRIQAFTRRDGCGPPAADAPHANSILFNAPSQQRKVQIVSQKAGHIEKARRSIIKPISSVYDVESLRPRSSAIGQSLR